MFQVNQYNFGSIFYRPSFTVRRVEMKATRRKDIQLEVKGKEGDGKCFEVVNV